MTRFPARTDSSKPYWQPTNSSYVDLGRNRPRESLIPSCSTSKTQSWAAQWPKFLTSIINSLLARLLTHRQPLHHRLVVQRCRSVQPRTVEEYNLQLASFTVIWNGIAITKVDSSRETWVGNYNKVVGKCLHTIQTGLHRICHPRIPKTRWPARRRSHDCRGKQLHRQLSSRF